MSAENFQKMRQIILQDLGLQKRLQTETELENFISHIIEMGNEFGLIIDREDILTAMRENRRIWTKRWL